MFYEHGSSLFKSLADIAPAMGMIGTLIGLVAMLSNTYKVLIDSVHPMTTEGVQQAHRHMATNQNIGKIVLSVSVADSTN